MASNKNTKLAMVDPQPAEDLNSKASETSVFTPSSNTPAIGANKHDDDTKPAESETTPSFSESKGDQASYLNKSELKSTENTQDPPLPPRRPKLERKESSFTINLKEFQSAFPDKPEDLCRALLVAASNNLEAAFQGMLALHDPSLRPNQYVREQIHSDEQLARELAIKDQKRLQQVQRSHAQRQRQPGYPRTSERDRYESYRNDDANSELYDDFQRGLSETKQAVSSFWGSIKSRISGELSDEQRDAFTEDAHVPGVPVGRRMSPNAPRLPPRTRSVDTVNPQSVQPSVMAPNKVRNSSNDANTPQRVVSEGARKAKEPHKEVVDVEHRSVNAFGDEQSAKSADQEPDAFFIGESDDDDLGSLDDNLDEELPIEKPVSDTSKQQAADNVTKPEKTADSAAPVASAETAETPAANNQKNERSAEEKKASEARSLLNKVKSQAESK